MKPAPAADPLEELAREASQDPAALGDGVTDLDAAAVDGQVPTVTNAQTLAAALAAAREAFCAFTKLQSPRETLKDETLQSIGNLWGPVLDKHGVRLSSMLGGYELELTAIIGTVSIVMAVHAGVKSEIAAIKSKASEEPAAQPDAANEPA